MNKLPVHVDRSHMRSIVKFHVVKEYDALVPHARYVPSCGGKKGPFYARRRPRTAQQPDDRSDTQSRASNSPAFADARMTSNRSPERIILTV